MEQGRVKKILSFCRNIDGEIKLKNDVLRDYEDVYYTSRGSDMLDGMPRSKYQTSNPTEAIILNVPNSVYTAMQGIREDIERLAALKAAILTELDKLPLTHKNILYYFYIKGLQWVQISVRVNYSLTQCKKIRNRGLGFLAKHFAENDLIKNFNYPR